MEPHMSIYNLNSSEIKSLALTLKQLRTDHILWLTALNKQIICNVYENSVNEDCTTSQFGQWFTNLATDTLASDDAFLHIGKLHKKLHQAAYELLLRHQRRAKIKQQEYEKFALAEEAFLTAFDNLHAVINSIHYSIDTLTELPNKGLFQLILEKEYAKLERIKTHNCLAFVDIDNFKQINDGYGHMAGDAVLQNIAKTLSASLRKYDAIGRYGGDEFLVFLPNTDIIEAKKILDRVLHEVQKLSIPVAPLENISVTCSFGLANFSIESSLSENLKNADKALYLAKESGRNIVAVYPH
jgi:diguanylate cyclase (GGDEF)-like protein